jgi:hypothetical protein
MAEWISAVIHLLAEEESGGTQQNDRGEGPGSRCPIVQSEMTVSAGFR